MSMIAADLAAAPIGNDSKSPVYQIAIPTHPTTTGTTGTPLYLKEDGTTVTVPADGKYQVTLTFEAASGRNATPVNVLVTWPAPADPAKASGRIEMVTALDRN